MTTRVLIVDDEPLARRGIAKRLERLPAIEVVGQCENGREAVAAIPRLEPDLVFLDVQMPGMNGFDVLAAIGAEAMPPVIFVTAYDQHALRAFEVHALDYLLKPIDDERFEQALERVHQHLAQQRDSALGRQFASLLIEMEPRLTATLPVETKLTERFVIKSGGRIFFVKAGEVDWIEAAGDYVCLHVGSRSHLLRQTMAAMESALDPDRFLRIHRSTIINAERIAELLPHFNGEYIVVMKDGTQLKMSRSYRDQLQAFFGEAL